jgi:N6-L-threonylcarbamoyladenine synthase
MPYSKDLLKEQNFFSYYGRIAPSRALKKYFVKDILCLGIETSCDDSSLSVVSSEGKIHSLLTQSHLACLQKYQGIVPETVSREHVKWLPLLLQELKSQFDISLIDCIAYTQGPGLAGSLLVGAHLAHSLALILNKPLLGIHHLEGHHCAAFLEKDIKPAYPCLSLIISGGHTQLMLIKQPGQYQILGQTLDDAAGEAFDKIGKHLGLGYPGGPIVAQLAAKGRPDSIKFSIPLAGLPTLDFSFSGFKTQAIRAWDKHQISVEDYCASVEYSIATILSKKAEQALKQNPILSIVLSGGVACNKTIRSSFEALAERFKCELYLPQPKYCTDNAAMIAYAGALQYKETMQISRSYPVDPIIKPRWLIEELLPFAQRIN